MSEMNAAFEIQNPQMVGKVFAETKVVCVECLPIRKMNFSFTAGKSRHDDMGAKVEAMMEAKNQLEKAKMDKEKTCFENKWTSLDRQIDGLVYDLCGLTEEEIKIVEEAVKEENETV